MFNDMKYAHLVIPTTSHLKLPFGLRRRLMDLGER